MTAPSPDTWLEANQRHLTAALAVVRSQLEACARRAAKEPEPAEGTNRAVEDALVDAERALPGPSAVHTLCSTFGLSSFERDVLLLAAGAELDSRFGSVCAAAQGDARRPYPTLGLAFAALADPHWSAAAPTAPLRRWQLVEISPGDTLTASTLRIDERVLHYLRGVSYLDNRLEGLVLPVRAPDTLPSSHGRIADRITTHWSRSQDAVWSAFQLCGADQGGKVAAAAAGCAALGMGLLRLRAADIPRAAGERTALARLCERELALARSALVLVYEVDTLGEGVEHAAVSFAQDMRGPLLIAAREALKLSQRPTIRLEVEKPTAEEQAALWRHALGPLGEQLNGQIESLVSQFSLDADGVRAASAMLEDPSDPGSAHFERLWTACRVQARRRLDDLAQRIDAVTLWDDLVLPEQQLHMLREVALHVRNTRTVYGDWGFATKGTRGLGISALFAGASGTGKTMAAEVLANELDLDAYRIDLSQVVSKYIGETEKNLRRIFNAAEESGAILLFDEADALFGKRSEVKDSHDRYANIEVSYLLQRMEAYRGLAILTTNMRNALDQAFLRRIRFIVQFAFPDAAQREEIWRRIFPRQTPTADLDLRQLARLNIAGGNIRNIAVNAAFLAADAHEPVRMAHLMRAAHSEYAKLEKPLTAAELGGWS